MLCVFFGVAAHFNEEKQAAIQIVEETAKQKEEELNAKRINALRQKKYNIYVKEQNGYNNDFFEVRLCWWDKLGEDGELLSGQDEPLKRFYVKKENND